MAEERANRNSQRPSFSVLINGTEIPSGVNVLAIEVMNELNRIETAKIKIADGEAAAETFALSAGDLFVPGNEVEIEMGYGGNNTPIFKGIIVKQRILNKGLNGQLQVVCKHKAFKLATSERFRIMNDTNDSDAIEQILDEAGISGNIETTSVTHDTLIQYKSTNWDFIVARAESNSLAICCNLDEVNAIYPQVNSPVIGLQYGATIISFEAELDASYQAKKLTSTGWSYTDQEIVEQTSELGDLSGAGNLSSSDLASALENEEELSHYTALRNQDEVEQEAKAEQQRRRFSKMRSTVMAQGFAEAKPGITITLSGLGNRFDGDVLVSGVAHTFKRGTWKTQLQTGLNESNHLKRFKPLPKSNYAIPRSSGLEIGLVVELEDTEGDFRAKVRFPVLNDEKGIWARVAQPDAGDNRGVFFRPEVDDEVIVGFVNNDPRNPIILGALHSAAKPAPFEQNNDNYEKGIVTKGELKLVFNDDKVEVLVETPSGNSIKLSEDDGAVTISDQNGNEIKMSEEGISLSSPKDIGISAQGDVNIEGVNVNVVAQAQFKAEGNAGAEVSSTASTTIKGAIVQIN